MLGQTTLCRTDGKQLGRRVLRAKSRRAWFSVKDKAHQPWGSSRAENHAALTACPELGSRVPGPEAEPLCLSPIPTLKRWASAEVIVSSSHGCLDFAILI